LFPSLLSSLSPPCCFFFRLLHPTIRIPLFRTRSVLKLRTFGLLVKIKIVLRPTISWPICLGARHPSETRDQFSSFFKLCLDSTGVLMLGALSDERTGLKFTIASGLASAVILGSESRGTKDHILLPQI
jgi:hypothetical protein